MPAGGTGDVALRAIANRLLQDLGNDLARFEITALRPPTFEQFQRTLTDAKAAGRPYHIVHFDGHGVYEDLSNTVLADWLKTINVLTLGGQRTGKHGYLLFEHPSSDANMRPVSGDELGKLLHDTGVPVLVLNACQSAMHEAAKKPVATANVHDEVRAIGSLAQAVIDQGIPAVLGMRYSVFVVTAAQYIGQLYANLAKGRPFGEAASEGRKHLATNPDRWVGLEPRPLQDWFVPVVYEAMPIGLLPAADAGASRSTAPSSTLSRPTRRCCVSYPTPASSVATRRCCCSTAPSTATRSCCCTPTPGRARPPRRSSFRAGTPEPAASARSPSCCSPRFETQTDLTDALNQIGQLFAPLLQANGIEWYALNDAAKRRSLVVQLLQQIPVLWIWDNVEPVAGFPAGTESQWTTAEQAELAAFLKQIKLDRATKAKILLTSRRDEDAWLGGIPYRVKMPRMSAADAAGLALEIGRERGLDRSQIAHWGLLLDYCAGNPLTLRIIAGQAVRMGLQTEQQIAAFIQAVRDGEQPIQDVDASQAATARWPRRWTTASATPSGRMSCRSSPCCTCSKARRMWTP